LSYNVNQNEKTLKSLRETQAHNKSAIFGINSKNGKSVDLKGSEKNKSARRKLNVHSISKYKGGSMTTLNTYHDDE